MRYLSVTLSAAIFSIIFLAGSIAGAEDPCASAKNQVELTACWGQAAADAESRMSKASEKAVAQLKAKGATSAVALLERAQARWRMYRDTQCAAVAKLYEGGSVQSMQKSNCRARLADQRTQEIEVMLTDWGGDTK